MESTVNKHIAIIALNRTDSEAGSVGSVAKKHALELSRWFHVHVFSVSSPEVANKHIHPVLLEPWQWNFLKRLCHVPNALSREWAARQRLKELCMQVPISAVWCHGHASVVLVGDALRKKHGFRLLMTTHGDIRDRPSGMYSRALTRYYKLLTCRAYRKADVVQALSPYMVELAHSGGASNIQLIPNGIEPSDVGLLKVPMRNAASYCPDGRVRLLYVGNLLPVKGVDVLLKAFALVCLDGAKYSLPSLTIVGDGPERACYEKLAKELAIEDKVSFLGRVARKDLGEIYTGFDVLCIPSLSEPLPTTGIEGMLCGLSIVGSNTGGIPYMVETSKTGWLCNPGSVEDLARSIRDVCHAKSQLHSFGAVAQKVALSRFNWEHIGLQLKALIE